MVVSIAGVVVTLWLALVVQRSAAKLTRLEFTRALRETWMHADDVTLRDPSLISLANQFHPHHETADPAFEQKRLYLFVYLNPINTAYQAALQGVYGTNVQEAIDAIKDQLKPVVADDDAFWVTQNHGYDPEFAALCRAVRQSLTGSSVAAKPT
ncbi:MAG: hypothetical protein ABIP53_01085 [Candidatus Limnocylindrales bacterium]